VTIYAHEWWVIATAVACCVACGVIGCFLVLRRLSMLGDAIAHAVLPGLAVAFMVSGSRAVGPMLLGAAGAGLLTVGLSSVLQKRARIAEDAAIGVVFTGMFATGVLMITWVASTIDLDPGCVLYGLLEFVAFDTVVVGGLEVPRALVALLVVAGVNIAVVAVFLKELRIVAFDPALAATMGISVGVVHYGLMGLVAATTVVSFEAVGSILVVTMLVAPGATAHLLTDRLGRMLWLTGVIAAASAVLGYFAAVWLNTSIAGMISVVAGGLFAAAVFLAPRHGYLGKVVVRGLLSMRIAREDVLAFLYRWEERAGQQGVRGPGAWQIAAALEQPVLTPVAIWWLGRLGWVGPGPVLTEAGRATAVGVVRSHRLWESYLAKHLPLAGDHLHAPSHRVEHFIGPGMREELAGELGAGRDPHGREIPGEDRSG